MQCFQAWEPKLRRDYKATVQMTSTSYQNNIVRNLALKVQSVNLDPQRDDSDRIPEKSGKMEEGCSLENLSGIMSLDVFVYL